MHLPNTLHRVVLLALGIPLAANAAEWSVEPEVSLHTGYDDNIRLTSAPHDSVWETVLSPKTKFGVQSEVTGLTGEAGFAIRRYTGGSGLNSSSNLDREDYHLTSTLFHNTRLNRFHANVNYIRDSTLHTALDETGQVVGRTSRNFLSIAPSWSSSLTELTRADLSYQYSHVTFDKTSTTSNLVNYDYHTVTAAITRQMTPRLQASLVGGFYSYRPESGFNANTGLLRGGVVYNFSEKFVGSLLAGERWTNSDSISQTGYCIGADPGSTYPECTGGTSHPTGYTRSQVKTASSDFTASLGWQLETAKLQASLVRSTSPANDGRLLNSTRVVLTGTRHLSETLDANLAVQYIENETLVGSNGVLRPNLGKDVYYRARPGIVWHWLREWKLSGEYRYAVSKSDNTANPKKATSNAFYIFLTYQPGKSYISR